MLSRTREKIFMSLRNYGIVLIDGNLLSFTILILLIYPRRMTFIVRKGITTMVLTLDQNMAVDLN